MAIFKQLDDQVRVSGQIARQDLRQAAADGVRLVISNRPDAEEPGQPETAEVARWAAEEGLAFAHIPVISGQLGVDAVAAMRQALAQSEGPVLAYCRSGGRSTALWALASAADRRHEPQRILSLARNAGYDLSGLAPALEQLSVHGLG